MPVASQTVLAVVEKSADLQTPKAKWLPCILHACDEPAFILSELDEPAACEITTEPNFGKDELDVDQRRLFTDSITD